MSRFDYCFLDDGDGRRVLRWKKWVVVSFVILILGAVATASFFAIMAFTCIRLSYDEELSSTLIYDFRLRIDSRQENYTIINSSDIQSNWNRGKNVMMLTHGWHDSGDASWIRDTEKYMLSTSDWCVVTIDWAVEADRANYIRSAKAARTIARKGAEVLVVAIEADQLDPINIYLVGHSLGAQLMSFIAKDVYYLTGTTVGRVTALEPAGPFFDTCAADSRLDRSDASYVDAIHTDAGVFPAQGMRKTVSDADFYINDGRNQPSCTDHACAHQLVTYIWTSTLDVTCEACPCESFDKLESCIPCDNTNAIGINSQPTSHPTTYFTNTTEDSPPKLLCYP